MATAGRHAPLTESMAVMGINVITKKAFVDAEKWIDEWWWTLLEESIKEAEEAEARSQNQYHSRFLAITVIVDSGWSKCCHKHSNNAKSGVAIIIGLEARKILYLGVRTNIAQYVIKLLMETYLCINVSTTGMNLQLPWRLIILKGFQESEAQYGLRYINYNGDGDSSVQPALVSGLLWGSDIKKLECATML